MTLTTAAKTATTRGLTAKFDLGYQAASPVYPRFCHIANSDGSDEKYGFLGSMPGVSEWKNERDFTRLRAGDFTIKNRTWESSLEIEREDYEDDRMGMYAPSFEYLGTEAAHHPDELLFELMVNGESSECYDGQNFFDTDHVWGDSDTQSNDLTYNATDHTNVTEAEFKAAYHAARQAMLGFKRDNGKLWVRPTVKPLTDLLLLVPLGLEEVANKAVNKLLVDSGETNVVLDRPAIMTSGLLTDSTKFYLYNLGTPFKPFVFQARQKLKRQFKGLTDREAKVLKFMTDARYNAGYFAWWNAVVTKFN